MVTGRVPGPFGPSETSGQLIITRRPLGVAGLPPIGVSLAPASVEHAAALTSHRRLAAVAAAPRRATKVIGGGGGHVTENRTLADFMQLVKDAQIRRLLARGRTEIAALPDADLEVVEGKHRMRKAAAASCRALLAAARTALEEAQAAKDHRARRTRSIGIQSAYRDYGEDARAWRGAFSTHYEATRAERVAAPGGEHGDAAVAVLAREMAKYKTPPGWSNHSNGMAVDFNTLYGGTLYAARSKQRAGWRTTWLHPWLVANAARHGFHPLSTEEWHWDFR